MVLSWVSGCSFSFVLLPRIHATRSSLSGLTRSRATGVLRASRTSSLATSKAESRRPTKPIALRPVTMPVGSLQDYWARFQSDGVDEMLRQPSGGLGRWPLTREDASSSNSLRLTKSNPTNELCVSPPLAGVGLNRRESGGEHKRAQLLNNQRAHLTHRRLVRRLHFHSRLTMMPGAVEKCLKFGESRGLNCSNANHPHLILEPNKSRDSYERLGSRIRVS